MKEHRVVKPLVHFHKFARYEEARDGTRIAVVYAVEDHPRLGRQPIVYTSGVVSVDNEESPTLIETENTIYKRVDSSESQK